MKTKTVTFHAAHNYGSMLQAYALQRAIIKLGCDNEIINLRTRYQREMYMRSGVSYNSCILKRVVQYVCLFKYLRLLHRKYTLFEDFLNKYLILTKEYGDSALLLEKDLGADCYIAGGDQIWKPRCRDFSWSYYLDFVSEAKCISYGVSIGPHEEEVSDYKDKIAGELSKFSSIGVREPGTALFIRQCTSKVPTVNLDPVFLLTKKDWESLIEKNAIIEGQYYFLYVPMFKKEVYEVALKLHRQTKKKIVISQLPIKALLYTSFEKKLDVGPCEFLNLIYNAEMVISGSFHALAFCLIMHKPFMGVNANKDNRSKKLLESCGLNHCSVDTDDAFQKLDAIMNTDFSKADDFLEKAKEESMEYLKTAIYGQ